VDPHHVDADPDSTCHPDADPIFRSDADQKRDQDPSFYHFDADLDFYLMPMLL
jgi:hypothetical protein